MKFLANPITALVLCLILGATAMSGKLSQHGANFLLVVAWMVGVFAITYSGIKDFRLLSAGVSMLTALIFLVSWLIKPKPSETIQT